MSIKSILVHVDDAPNAAARFRLAAALGIAQDAHLTGLATTGVTRFLYETVTANRDNVQVAPYLATLRKRADAALNEFGQVAHQLGAKSVEPDMSDDDPAGGLILRARYCDLIVLGQADPAAARSALGADLPETVAAGCGCPVLLAPFAGTFEKLGAQVLLAWNSSIEAARAMRAALPLMDGAASVKVALFQEALPDATGALAGDAIAAYLAQHGIRAEVIYRDPQRDTGAALLALATEVNADLLVMGCYTHSRMREVVLGGTTRTVLKSMTLPVLMSH